MVQLVCQTSLPPSDQPSGYGTGSFIHQYNAATESLGFVTGSDFHPFVTQIGLYTEDGDLQSSVNSQNQYNYQTKSQLHL